MSGASDLAALLERVENLEAAVMLLINGDDDTDPGPGDTSGGGSAAEPEGNEPMTGDAATRLRARLLAGDAVTRACTTATIRSIEAKAAAMWRKPR